jgi:hypothetical protein
MSPCACRRRDTPSPRSGLGTSCSPPTRAKATICWGYTQGRWDPSAVSRSPANPSSTQSTSASWPVSNRARPMTAARWRICARRWWPPACSRSSRSNRSAPRRPGRAVPKSWTFACARSPRRRAASRPRPAMARARVCGFQAHGRTANSSPQRAGCRSTPSPGRRNNAWARRCGGRTPVAATARFRPAPRSRAKPVRPMTPGRSICRRGFRATAPRCGKSAGPTPMGPS